MFNSVEFYLYEYLSWDKHVHIIFSCSNSPVPSTVNILIHVPINVNLYKWIFYETFSRRMKINELIFLLF